MAGPQSAVKRRNSRNPRKSEMKKAFHDALDLHLAQEMIKFRDFDGAHAKKHPRDFFVDVEFLTFD